MKYAPWLEDLRSSVIQPRAAAITAHPFVKSMQEGRAERQHAQGYFSGLMWHLLDFSKHVEHLMRKRPQEVSSLLQGRHEDEDGDTDILGRIVEAFGGPRKLIEENPWLYRPDPVWIKHDALLRAAIYSTDLPWQVGTAALNIGIETLVPTMVEPLYHAAVEKYGVSRHQAQWLDSRAGEIEKQHGENGYILLNACVPLEDKKLQAQCALWAQSLADSMATGLLTSGMPPR